MPADVIKVAAQDGRRLLIPAILLAALMIGLGFLLTHVLQSTAIGRWDTQISRDLAAHRSGGPVAETGTMTRFAATPTITVLTIAAFVAFRWLFGRWLESLYIAFAVAGEVLIFTVTTLFVDRSRPAVSHLDAAPPTSSFPSGHTAAAVCFYGAVAMVIIRQVNNRWVHVLALLVAVAMPLAIGSSRVYRGMHYSTDVLSGLLLGVIWLAIVTHFVWNREDHPGRRPTTLATERSR